jgi:integrase
MLTGQRRNEIADLHWSEIDFERREITLPQARTKNKRVHVVPMSDSVLSILSRVYRIAGRDFVFGEGKRGYQRWSASKAELDCRITLDRAHRGELPIAPWHLHDLRRSFVTHMLEQRLALPHIVEACVNHSGGHRAGVAGVYNRASYSDEKREAFAAWSAALSQAVIL